MKVFEIKALKMFKYPDPEKAFYETPWRLRTGTKGQLLMIDENKIFF
jgi:hypothetical protein